MPSPDAYDEFLRLYTEHQKYPTQQLGVRSPQEAFYNKQQREKLEERKKIVFNADDAQVDFWETVEWNKPPSEGNSVDGTEALRTHLERVEKDPQIRHVFIASDDSRSPINCSRDMFTSICSYHQVEPSFLESVHAFGEQDEPTDLCLSHFRANDKLNHRFKDTKVQRMGRSGREIRLSYLLRSAERSSTDNGSFPWSIRQAANYHSFDVENGRAFWLTIKGDNLFERRIKDFSSVLNTPSKEDDIASYLRASLATHMVYISWCDEGWRRFINDLEGVIRDIVRSASTAVVDDHFGKSHTPLPRPLRRSQNPTMYSKKGPSRRSTMNPEDAKAKKSPTFERLNATSSRLNSWLRREKNPDLDLEQGGNNNSQTSLQVDPHDTLNEVRFADMQTLHSHAEAIQKAILVIDLNKGVLGDISQHYSDLAATEFKPNPECVEAIEGFLKEVMAISRSLATRSRQLQCLATNLEQNMILYDRALQQRTIHINNQFATIGHDSNKQMQDISDKTARQTTSMHVITVATLFFLPATFVATFFQSGAFLWNEQEAEDMTGPYKWQGGNFRLFLKICIPLTVVTIGTWFVIFLMYKKKRECLEEPVSSDSNEKR